MVEIPTTMASARTAAAIIGCTSCKRYWKRGQEHPALLMLRARMMTRRSGSAGVRVRGRESMTPLQTFAILAARPHRMGMPPCETSFDGAWGDSVISTLPKLCNLALPRCPSSYKSSLPHYLLASHRAEHGQDEAEHEPGGRAPRAWRAPAMLPPPLPACVPARHGRHCRCLCAVPLAVPRCQRALYASSALGKLREPRRGASPYRRRRRAVPVMRAPTLPRPCSCRSCAGPPPKPRLCVHALC